MFLYNKRLILALVVFFYTTAVKADDIRPLNILFVVGHFPAPSQTFILNMITGLIDKGHNVSIFSFKKDKVTDIHPHIGKYQLMDRVIYEKFPQELPECDIVFCQFGYLGKKIFELKELEEWLKRKKVVVCFRGSDLTAYVKNNPKMYKKLFKQADLFLPVCKYFKKRLVSLGADPNKIVIHHSAIDCSQFFFKKRKPPKDRCIQLVSVCRLVEKKGIHIAISAVAKVLRKNKQTHFTIVGDGPERIYLEKMIKKMNIADHVTLHGWGAQGQVVTFLDKSHIFLLPSMRSADGNEEGIPNALKEAMAMGLIAVGTWHAGTPELIEDKISGFLVPEGDSTQLAKTIEYIIEHPEKWSSIGLAGRKKIEDDFEIEKSILLLEKIFYQLVHCN